MRPGQTKITFGTGGMLDTCTGPGSAGERRSAMPHGTFPIVAWTTGGELTWGAEAIMLSAGTNVEWLVDDLGILATPPRATTVASACDDTGGVVYVPALLGLGTPHWDYGARGTLLGLTRGHRPARDRAGRARGHRPARRRPGRGGRGRHRRSRSRRCGSTAA